MMLCIKVFHKQASNATGLGRNQHTRHASPETLECTLPCPRIHCFYVPLKNAMAKRFEKCVSLCNVCCFLGKTEEVKDASVNRMRVTSRCRTDDDPRTASGVLHVPESTRASLIHSLLTSLRAEANQRLSVQVTISYPLTALPAHSALFIGNRRHQLSKIPETVIPQLMWRVRKQTLLFESLLKLYFSFLLVIFQYSSILVEPRNERSI